MRILILALLFGAVSLAQLAAPNSAGVTMGHLHLISADPEAQKKCWVEGLGGRPVKIGPLDFAVFPGLLVGFRKGDSSGGTAGSVINHLGFHVKDSAKVKSSLAAAGAQITRETAGGRNYYAIFPGGVEVEIGEDTKLDVPVKPHHIHFASQQIDEMRAWYVKHFGATPFMRGTIKAASLPGVNLSWDPASEPPLPTKGRVLDHIGIEVKDLDGFARKLEASGIKLEMPVTPRPDLGLKIAFLSDPWGGRIELTEGLASVK